MSVDHFEGALIAVLTTFLARRLHAWLTRHQDRQDYATELSRRRIADALAPIADDLSRIIVRLEEMAAGLHGTAQYAGRDLLTAQRLCWLDALSQADTLLDQDTVDILRSRIEQCCARDPDSKASAQEAATACRAFRERIAAL
ncbi:MAG: hypothetical protein HN742_07130 [Lentisphaerae bacterium]|nr:hypothetical protein [Lentisphaerota bacterium]MBT7841626.1 hypothetical protein [Lentisphaerota bacterium]